MKRFDLRTLGTTGLVLWVAWGTATGRAAPEASVEIGLAVRDVTPEVPIWLAGYAARNKPGEKVDTPLVAQAMALRNPSGERFVFVALDNCEVSREFNAPVLEELEASCGMQPGEVMILSSHTHSAPVLEGNLAGMYPMSEPQRQAAARYGRFLQSKLIEVTKAALANVQPARLEHGLGRATFAMNRRVYQGDQVVFGENPDGPVDWDVPVLTVRDTSDALKAIVFGYACHPTSIHGEDFYTVTGDYIAYARHHLETVYPGTAALFLPGMGADSNPSPRGRLIDAKRHGLQLAGAVVGVLNRPMRPVQGQFKMAYQEVPLPLTPVPNRARLEADAQSADPHVRRRAESYLRCLDQGQPPPESVTLPVAVVRIGKDLTFLAMGGEVVVDYARQFKRRFLGDHPWTVGYAYEVPCYIPSARIIKEGGYESESSLIYYGYYGPFAGRVEQVLAQGMAELMDRSRLP